MRLRLSPASISSIVSGLINAEDAARLFAHYHISKLFSYRRELGAMSKDTFRKIFAALRSAEDRRKFCEVLGADKVIEFFPTIATSTSIEGISLLVENELFPRRTSDFESRPFASAAVRDPSTTSSSSSRGSSGVLQSLANSLFGPSSSYVSVGSTARSVVSSTASSSSTSRSSSSLRSAGGRVVSTGSSSMYGSVGESSAAQATQVSGSALAPAPAKKPSV